MFVIVRHGNTFEAGETPRRIGARTDLSLTMAGIAQGHALGSHFAAREYRFTRVLVSPLLRTRQTASAILEHLVSPPAVETCEWLREIDHGPDEDRPEDAVLARIGKAALDAWDRSGTPPPGWSVDGAERRAAWQALFASSSDGSTLIVTSNGAARFALLAEPQLVAASSRLATLKLPTGGYGIVQRHGSGAWHVPIWGRRP
jgi:probable phosphoglycerate mutase